MEHVPVTRRQVCVSLAAALAWRGDGTEGGGRGPLLWVATKGNSAVYLLPFGEARDGSWFTPQVRRAFESSQELGPPPPQERVAVLYEELGHDKSRTLFDALTPPVRAAATRYMQDLDIPRESVLTMRPWLAYYTFVAAFDRKYGRSEGFTKAARSQRPPDWVLGEEALERRKPVHFELTMEEWLRKLAAMPDPLQSQYLQWLFDYFDDKNRGLDRDRFDWARGRLVARAIDRMRTQLPELYEILDGQRNRWWARRIGELLAIGGTYFAALGQDHFADSRGIPTLLTELRIVEPSELKLI
jgi:uncharacterized protein YbaP (TraB family)